MQDCMPLAGLWRCSLVWVLHLAHLMDPEWHLARGWHLFVHICQDKQGQMP